MRGLPNILFLGKDDSKILAHLKDLGHRVKVVNCPLIAKSTPLRGCTWLVSHGYRYIVPGEVLAMFPRRAINCHISLLPWNRGSDPNLWSWIDDTPKGVTIHRMTEGLDKGSILVGWEVFFDEISSRDTLRTTYNYLQEVLAMWFRNAWRGICTGVWSEGLPIGKGSYHSSADKDRLGRLLQQGWDTPVTALMGLTLKTSRIVQARSSSRIRESIGASPNNPVGTVLQRVGGS